MFNGFKDVFVVHVWYGKIRCLKTKNTLLLFFSGKERFVRPLQTPLLPKFH